MGKLKPIGSEKLTGANKIQRMIEISRYKENIPNSINEDNSIEYSRTLPNGVNYQIVKEKNGYVIKKSLNENTLNLEYLEPLKNRKYYSSYSQAFKRLNLIVKEINLSLGNKKNISLFEAADEATKYILKFNETNEEENPEVVNQSTQQPAPQQASSQQRQPTPEPETQTTSVSKQPETVEPSSEETPMDEPTDNETSSENSDEHSEVVNLKTIQKLTGKLSQKLREFTSNEENTMSSKDIKYVINSILSALDLNSLEDEDKEQIITKFEGTDENIDNDMDNEDSETDDEISSQSEVGQEVNVDAPEPPQNQEMTENFDESINHNPKKDSHHNRAKEMFETLFSESKVENVLKKYFEISKNEKNNYDIYQKIKKYSTNIIQEVTAKKVLKKYPNAKFLGKTKKATLVFEINENKLGITKNGKIL